MTRRPTDISASAFDRLKAQARLIRPPSPPVRHPDLVR